MTNNNNLFFNEKKPWSETKDDLLSCYLTPFFSKTYKASRNGIVYIDAFCGPGHFDDGKDGSPLIAAKKLIAISKKQQYKHNVQFILADADKRNLNKAESELIKATAKCNYIMPPIVCNDFKDAVEKANAITFKGKRPSTFFLYADPYGVKDLDLNLFAKFPNPKHTEVLVNFNTIGFLRDAFAALQFQFEVPDDVEVYDSDFSFEIPSQKRVERLTACIGSHDWIDIIKATHNGKKTFWEAEREIGALFCHNAKRTFKYVTNMPIKDMSRRPRHGGEVKYRMIHMTNNADGCVLMNDNMIKRNESQHFQQSLFKVDIDGSSIKPGALESAMQNVVSELPLKKPVAMNVIAAQVISKCGVTMRSSKILKSYLKPFLENGVVERLVKFTPTHKPKNSFSGNDKVYRIK